MKNYNFTQVRKALENKGFAPYRGFGNEWESTIIFKKSSGTQLGKELATVEIWEEDGTCTIDGLCPFKWGKQQFA